MPRPAQQTRLPDSIQSSRLERGRSQRQHCSRAITWSLPEVREAREGQPESQGHARARLVTKWPTAVEALKDL